MGNIEDLRKVIQDFVAPDLRALSARIDGLEKTINARFDAANTRFDAMAATMAANHAAMMQALDLERRLAKLESQRRSEVQQTSG
jgi:capsule polysaccharide export protein KpsE/RkpR